MKFVLPDFPFDWWHFRGFASLFCVCEKATLSVFSIVFETQSGDSQCSPVNRRRVSDEIDGSVEDGEQAGGVGQRMDEFVSLFQRGEWILVCRRTSEGHVLDCSGVRRSCCDCCVNAGRIRMLNFARFSYTCTPEVGESCMKIASGRGKSDFRKTQFA